MVSSKLKQETRRFRLFPFPNSWSFSVAGQDSHDKPLQANGMEKQLFIAMQKKKSSDDRQCLLALWKRESLTHH